MKYLEALKFEDISLEVTAKTVKSPLRGFCSDHEGSFKEKKGEITGIVSGKAITEKIDPAPLLPAWCRAGCPSLDVIPGAGPGCVLTLADGPWSQEWRRIDNMRTCPERTH